MLQAYSQESDNYFDQPSHSQQGNEQHRQEDPYSIPGQGSRFKTPPPPPSEDV